MKILIGVVLLLILALAGFFLGSNEVDAPADDTAAPATNEELSTEEASSDADTTNSETETTTELGVAVETETGTETFTLDSFNYGYSAEEIRVPAGTEVTINLTNSEGFHDWVVDEFDAATEKISTGETTSVTFVADTSGTYEYYCSVGNHRAQGMVGTLIVE